MTLDDIRPFLEAEHHGVVTTFRRNGTAQMSIVASGIYRDQAVFVARGDTAKLGNLTRGPPLHCPDGEARLVGIRLLGGASADLLMGQHPTRRATVAAARSVPGVWGRRAPRLGRI